MELALPGVATDFAASAARAFSSLGGVELARRAERDPGLREAEALPALERLGVPDLPAREDLDAAVAGAELCRVAGGVVFPYPVAAVLARPPGRGALALVDPGAPRIDHGDVAGPWLAADMQGSAWAAEPASRPRGSRLGPFVVDARLGAPAAADPGAVALALTLGAATVLGAAETALALTTAHVRDRVQFGRPLAEFQAVQFQVADMVVAVEGLRELLRFTLWRMFSEPDDALVDGLALRLRSLECARQVFRTAHQLHGAIGFCDEHDLSVVHRHVQPALRLPADLEMTTALLADAVAVHGFSGLFGVAPFRGGRG